MKCKRNEEKDPGRNNLSKLNITVMKEQIVWDVPTWMGIGQMVNSFTKLKRGGMQKAR